MLKANTKNLISILIPLTALLVSGCSDPQELRTDSFNEVAQLRAAGDPTAALAKLETLTQAHPNDPEVLQEIGEIHNTLGNTTEAAFYLSAAHALAPNDIELHYQAYLAQEATNQADAAYELLEALVKAEPDAITSELWLRLGALRAKAQQTQSALDAYLKGVDPENSVPDAETAAAIGTLFKQLDNLPQAERWFSIAANSDDPNALPALFGLLDIHLRTKNWVEAEAAIAQLDQQFPGAVDASEWASYRGELEGWRAAQAKLQADLAKKLAAEEAAKKATAEAKAEAVVTVTAVQSIEPTETSVTDSSDADSTESSAGKAQIIADLEHAEAMADTPAVEADEPESIAYNPDIAIEPAEPAFPGVTYDQQNQGATTDDSIGSSDLNDSIAPDVVIPGDTAAIEPSSAISTLPPRSLDHILADAESATFEHDYKEAIQLYWQALGRANNRADIWNMLSRAYRFDGQTKNAETTALEATRLAPAEIDYTLDYLRVIQRTKKPEDFLAELQTAYDRFPRSPEIALSLARAYERIDGNNSAAIMLYERFIQLAPNHSLRSEAEAALSRLR